MALRAHRALQERSVLTMQRRRCARCVASALRAHDAQRAAVHRQPLVAV